MRGMMTQQPFLDEVDTKKKKRRSHRRDNYKQNSCSASGIGTNGEVTDSLENNNNNNNSVSTSIHRSSSSNSDNHVNAGFSSLPAIIMQDRNQFSDVLKDKVVSTSCQDPISRQEINGHYAESRKKNYFNPHWSVETVNEAIQKGDVFLASFRVNAHNRLEAYCSVDGLPTDVLISGVAAQNRAVEGDIVAVKMDPLALWTRMKGSCGHISNCTPSEGSLLVPKANGDSCKGKEMANDDSNKNISSSSYPPTFGHDPSKAISKICALISSFPSKRPTGTIVSIVQKSPRRNAVVGFLGFNQSLSNTEGFRKETHKKNNLLYADQEFIQLIPNDAKFPKMLVSLSDLPDCIKKRFMEGDATLELELVGARIDNWREDNRFPHAHVMHTFGRGGEIGPQVAAILFQHALCLAEFSPELLPYLPKIPWEVPVEELERRKDLRHLCIFTIDPPTATDLDDALSVERVSDGIFRVGVHIADVSHFVLPDTPLDIEAQNRSTSVYLQKHKLPMLPPLLSENIASLIPGLDRLAFSMFFDCNLAGDVVDRWIGRTVIHSCCKLSYEHAQDMIDGLMDAERHDRCVNQVPEPYGQFGWEDVILSVKNLYEISKKLKENRFRDGAIHLESSKPFLLFDKQGIPYDSTLCERLASNYLVEEYMLLVNRTAAEVISRAYPDCALLRRHPEPNVRKLREFEAFCRKHGLELDTSSSSQFNLSLESIRETLKDDPVLFDILISYASRPMQLAMYFCTGNFRDREDDWAHYALAMPLYTHFTSPLRRYADIVVHRTLSAALEAEEIYLQHHRMIIKASMGKEIEIKCFSDLRFDIRIAENKECREALDAAAMKHRVPCMKMVANVASYCNEKRMASRHAEDAGEKLYLWALLKKKQTLIVEARVLGLGPKFMSIYIHKLAIERRIYYDEVEGLSVEWLETTSSLVLDLCTNMRNSRRGSSSKFRPLEDVAWVINPCYLESEQPVYENEDSEVPTNGGAGGEGVNKIQPAAFPLTVRILSAIYVALHPIGGDDGPLDIGARLYACSYLM